MPERIKTKCGGGGGVVAKKKIEGGICRRG